MILVVVLTVLLSLIGLMFILASRIEQATSLSANVDRDLSAGVDSVVDRINKVLVDDLFGPDRKAQLADGTCKDSYGIVMNEAFDFAGDQDRWLSSLSTENGDPAGTPDNIRDDVVDWRRLSDLYYDVFGIVSNFSLGLGGWVVGMTVGPDLYSASDGGPWPRLPNNNLIVSDADGDGVWDSVWVKLPNISSAKGQPLYSAVRIIDNCAMLNLNTAFKQDPASEGQYLSEVDYERFRRGSDRDNSTPYDPAKDAPLADRIRRARMAKPNGTLDTVQQYHDRVIMQIENPAWWNRYDNSSLDLWYHLFELSDELEIRNRVLLTTAFEARFERPDVANYTFDAGVPGVGGGGVYAVLQVPCTDEVKEQFTVGGKNYTRTSFDAWKIRMNSANFDDKSGAYFPPSAPNLDQEDKLDFRWKYDRRHVCTFYSFDRNIRSGRDPVLEPAVERMRQAWLAETNTTQRSQKDLDYRLTRMLIWPDNGSVVSTRDVIVGLKPISKANPPVYVIRETVLRLLYSLRASYLMHDNQAAGNAAILADLDDPATPTPFDGPKVLLGKAAVKAAQTVANLIDYLDDTDAATQGPFFQSQFGNQKSPEPTFITEALVMALLREASPISGGSSSLDLSTQPEFAFGLYQNNKTKTGPLTIYGYERQPFISELYCTFSASGIGRFAVEFVNPYDQDIRLEGWKIIAGNPKSSPRTFTFTAANSTVPKGTPKAPGRFVLRNINWGALPNATPTCEWPQLAGGVNGFVTKDVILLQRPVPDGVGGRTFLTVDQTEPGQIAPLLVDGTHTQKRDDKAWKFANSKEMLFDNGGETLGSANGIDIPSAKGYQMPVADNNGNTADIRPIATLGDFEKILTIGSKWISATDPNAITHFVGLASKEGDVRTDIESAPELLGHVGFLNRSYDPATGDAPRPLPGRININTATKEVIRAAIPPNPLFESTPDQLADAIITWRKNAPFTSLADLLKVDEFAKLGKDSKDITGSDPSMIDDIEERDWILSRLSNIFTVRSDTFTAYIAIRIGAPRVVPNTDPAKRVVDVDADRRYIAIFDRSAVDQPDKSPRLVALHPVPESR